MKPIPTDYVAPPKHERHGIALALSGGGYRATLFHLGAVRRLNELGVLPQITTFCSVSGGSILDAQLATSLPWPVTGPLSSVDWNRRMTAPVRSFTSQDIRTDSLAKRWLLPWNWFRDTTEIEHLAKHYEAWFPSKLAALPETPQFLFCSTDLAVGINWTFTRERMGDSQLGHAPTPPDWSLGRTVAASSCFPPVFNPLPIRIPADRFSGGYATPQDKAAAFHDLRIDDGGTYDTLGLESVWKTHATILCSDGGGAFLITPDRGWLDRIKRYLLIQFNQSVNVRKRWLIDSFVRGEYDGAYWGASSAPIRYGVMQGYSKELARTVISQVRTDLDHFSDAEQSVLENHGYFLADAALKTHAKGLIKNPDAPLEVPYPDWMDEAKVRNALKDSSKNKVFGH
jgi:NTE family protein